MTAILHGLWRLALTLLALPFALISWLWICLRTAGSGALLGGLLSLLCNVVLLQPPDLHHGVLGLLLGGVAGWVLALVNLLGPVSFGHGNAATSHGSAAWAAPRQLRRDLAAAALARDPAALLVGRAPGHRGALLRYAGLAHLLTIAPTRSGKGVGTVLPNLLLSDRAILCVDPKGRMPASAPGPGGASGRSLCWIPWRLRPACQCL
ncbi:type IV secretory system conjugative DNA transfer family protein [Pseudoroseomonas wenyumeiae]